MRELPTGTVTLVFTDIEGSTRILQRLGSTRYAEVLQAHHRVIRGAIKAFGGVEVQTEGDSFFAIFPRASDAIAAAVDAQRGLAAVAWPEDGTARVRMGIHTGDVSLAEGEYMGLDVHRAARISGAAHGGQVIISDATRSVVERDLPPGVRLQPLGDHLLRDLEKPERLFQLVIDGLRNDFPPIRSASSRLDRLPAEITSFVGRERELERARELLGGTRLLTLTGPGGTGKTRLAQRLAHELAPTFPDGAAFVALAAIGNTELVAPTIRHDLGYPEEPGRSAVDTIVDALHARRALLVLDNFEQVLDAAPVIEEILERTLHLKVLVTSRAALRIAGEQEMPVPPLVVPGAGTAMDLDAMSRSEAVALFVQRARRARPDFGLTLDNARVIRDICARLDGLPLAIELAASRIRLLTPEALLARLGKRLDLLQSTGGSRTDRQRTLRGAIDWSYDLLGPNEQELFRRLAIFVGGWSLEDAEAVVTATGGDVGAVLDGLSALVGHSLVRQDESAGEPRFTMLETIREYGLEQLKAAGELDSTADAHARRFAGLVAQAAPHLTAGPAWPDRLERDHDNIRAALAWLADNDTELALATAGALWRFLHLRGHLREGREALGEILARPDAQAPTNARARALVGYGGLVYWMRDHALALQAYEEALPIAHATGDRALEAEVLYSLGYVYGIEKKWAESEAAYAQAGRLYGELGSEVGRALSDMGAGMVRSLQGDHAAAMELLRPALRRFEELGDSFGYRNTLAVLTRTLMHLGELDEAWSTNRQNIQAAHEQQDPTALSAGLLDMAALESLAGRHERAARLHGAAETIVRQAGGEAPPQLINRVEYLPAVQAALEPGDYEHLVAEGRMMSTDEAVAFALAGEAGARASSSASTAARP